jgi:HEAT repeat protein
VAVRPLLDAEDGAVVQAAAIALARIGDHDDVLPLIERLETETSGPVIDRLDGTLARITGAACRRDPVRWRAWYEREAGWFERDVEHLLQDLADPRDEIVFAALHELRKHPLYRAELAPDVAVVLDHDSPALRLTAAQVLGELAHEPSIEELIPSLDDADSSVATAACAALRKISGLDLLCDRESWIRALRAPGS